MDQLILNKEFEAILAQNISGRLHAAGDNDLYVMGTRDSISLLHAVKDYEAGKISLPPHQRDKCWSKEREMGYLMTLSQDAFPPGSFEFYQLIEDGRRSVKFLNDGSQRLRAAFDFLHRPDEYGISKGDAEYLLENTSYPYTLKTHRSHEEAMRRFQIVNNNLELTNYQKVIGDVIYCEKDEGRAFWEQFIDSLHRQIYDISLRIVADPYPNEGTKDYWKTLHLRKRHDLSLLLRFLEKDKDGRDYKPGVEVKIDLLDGISISRRSYFEKELAHKLKSLGKSRVEGLRAKFIRVLELETSLFEGIWPEIERRNSDKMGAACYRWLLDIAIWRRNRGIEVNPWADFVRKFLDKSGGTTNVLYTDDDGEPRRLNVSLSRVSIVPTLCYILDSDIAEKKKRQRRRRIKNKRKGWHESHIQPFSTHGDGETILEPGMINMARGAKPIES